MNDSKKVLIVSVYYNRESQVDESISSVISQLDANDVLLLVDDGSTDSTYRKLKAFEAANVKVVCFKNQGFTWAIKQAIHDFPSEYIAVHGAGDVSFPERFRKQCQILDSNEQIGVVGTWYEDYDVTTDKSLIRKKTLANNIQKGMSEHNPFGHSTVMFKRKFYELAGGYNPYFSFAQDRDLWCRMSRHCDFYMIEESLVKRYQFVSNSVSGDYKKSLRQRYFSDFAVYLHENRITEQEVSEIALRYRPSFSLKKDLFKRSVKAVSQGKKEVLDYYKEHILSGRGYIFMPFYFIYNLLPNVISKLLKLLK